jgi:hypothetical protein
LARLDSYPDSEYGSGSTELIESGTNTDPKPWLQGSKIPLYVCLLRELTHIWHQKLGGLVRFPNEEEPNSLHLLCDERPPGGDMVFDIHLEQRKVLSGMNLPTAVASFFHVAFIGQLRYPREGEAVAILLQRKLAKVDPEGKRKMLGGSGR